MTGFFRRHAAVLIAVALVSGLAPSLTAAQQDPTKSAPPVLVPPADTQAVPVTPAPADAMAPPAKSTPVITKETVDNPYGLEAILRQGDWVSLGTLGILGIMSMGTWYILIVKLWEQYKLMREGRDVRSAFWKAPSLREGATRLDKKSAYRYIAETGLEANEHHEGALTENIDLNTWVTMSVQRSVDAVQARTQDGLAFLATVGSTAPFVGLFGTVWGIYHALTAIGIAGQASIDKVAGPVGEALIMTALGLAVAVPAVMGYNWLIRRNKVAMDAVRTFGADLHAVLLGGRPEIKGAPAGALTRSR
ncbi:MAG: MotA/TolQ/ExbB proton channel family protein [Pseudomonadota bacterium]|nr:MotA/TolQ/ExbB proton channel family protein [Pseudomonadota bacterium]